MISIRNEIKQIEAGAANKDNNVLKVRAPPHRDATCLRRAFH